MIHHLLNNYNFIKSLKNDLKYIYPNRRGFEELENTLLQKGQAVYVVDYKKNEIVFKRNIYEVLGYSNIEFTSKLVHQDILHPKQKIIAGLVIKSAIMAATNGEIQSPEAKFVLLYKVKHKSGTYRTVLRQTGVFEKNSNNIMTAVYSIITDVTEIIETDKVQWKLEGANKAFEDDLNSKIVQLSQSIFTSKELEIIKHLNRGESSEEIAEKLGNSKHTIDTHRRKMLRKANCKNTPELIYFAESIDLI